MVISLILFPKVEEILLLLRDSLDRAIWNEELDNPENNFDDGPEFDFGFDGTS